ncbi:hypothetical protein HK405_006968 [Cladochytrium tenue]|nr:hypothetical protein HK405_006968 [Cladochytrium tenue]
MKAKAVAGNPIIGYEPPSGSKAHLPTRGEVERRIGFTGFASCWHQNALVVAMKHDPVKLQRMTQGEKLKAAQELLDVRRRQLQATLDHDKAILAAELQAAAGVTLHFDRT